MADGFRPRLRQGRRVRRDVGSPARPNLGHGIANANDGFDPDGRHHGQVPSHLIGSDAFQAVDITGITLPITNTTSSWSRRPPTSARPSAKAFYIAASGRPGPVLVDITKSAQKRRPSTATTAPRSECPGYRPESTRLPAEMERAVT